MRKHLLRLLRLVPYVRRLEWEAHNAAVLAEENADLRRINRNLATDREAKQKYIERQCRRHLDKARAAENTITQLRATVRRQEAELTVLRGVIQKR